jgi:hypothetical protein
MIHWVIAHKINSDKRNNKKETRKLKVFTPGRIYPHSAPKRPKKKKKEKENTKKKRKHPFCPRREEKSRTIIHRNVETKEKYLKGASCPPQCQNIITQCRR